MQTKIQQLIDKIFVQDPVASLIKDGLRACISFGKILLKVLRGSGKFRSVTFRENNSALRPRTSTAGGEFHRRNLRMEPSWMFYRADYDTYRAASIQ